MNTENRENSGLSILYFISIWAIYASLYYALKIHGVSKEYAGLLTTAGDTILNITMVFFSFWLWKRAVKEAKLIFGFFTLSFSFVIIPNALYQFLFNVLHIKVSYFSSANIQLVIHHIMYAICLLLEFAAWVSVVAYAFSMFTKSRIKIYSLIVTILVSFLAVLVWKTNYAGLSVGDKFFRIYTSSFYIINFILAASSLAICKNKGLFYLSLGYIIIIGADLIMTFGIMSQHLGTGSMFDTSWFLGLLLMLYGFLCFKREGNYMFSPSYWLSKPNSIKTQSVIWNFAVCFVSLGSFLSANSFFNHGVFF